MRMFYCPKCGHFELKKNFEENPYANELTIKNMIDFSFVPIQHYKCECGNFLAGYFEFVTENDIKSGYTTDEGYESFHKLGDKQQEDNILFYKDIIMHFNEGGRNYNRKFKGKNMDFENLGEFAKWCYYDRLSKENTGTLDKGKLFSTEPAISQMLQDINS